MRRYDSAKLANARRTPGGGLRVDATLTRVGVFEYRNADGSPRKEYRPPTEVFKADAIEGFKAAPVTIGHPGLVTAANWRQHAIGHVADDVRQDGDYVRGSVVVQDAEAIKQIESGELAEISCGYDVDLLETPGTTPEGERYDAIQTNIRGNHVALGPVGWGRAGRDVGLRLDGDEPTPGDPDPVNFEVMSDPAKAAPTKIEAKDVSIRVDGAAQIEKLQARVDLLEAENKDLKDKLAAEPARMDAAVSARMDLLDRARALAPKLAHAGKSNREIQIEAIQAKKPEFKADGKSDDYVAATFEFVSDAAKAAPTPALGALRVDAANVQANGVSANAIEDARKKMVERSANAWKGAK